MKQTLTFIFFYFLVLSFSLAQVTFEIDSLPAYTPAEDTLYIAGNFTDWNPGHPEFKLQKINPSKWAIKLDSMPPGTQISFKFTRGSWATVEKGPNGEEIGDRSFTYGNGDTVGIIIYNWADAGGGGGSTAADNVHIVDEAFYIPQFDRERRVWIYLPPDYETSGADYPVMYMHDGQNLFDAYTSFAGEWEVDETLNELADEGIMVPIVVGVDNGGSYRIDEYTPWTHPMHGGGDGDLYMQFLVETLKPYIDEHYRTIADQQHTAIMGSSLGGLISHYGLLAYQDIFSKAGVFSPSFWYSDSVWAFTSEAGNQNNLRTYMMSGSMEGSGTVANMFSMQDTLLNNGFTDDNVVAKVVPGGQHNEQLWRREFREAYLWLFQDWAGISEWPSAPEYFLVSPNPVVNGLYLDENLPVDIDSILILDMTGKPVMETKKVSSRVLQVGFLAPGTYIILVHGEKKWYQAKFVKSQY